MTDRTRHKMMQAMIKEHWRSIDPQWKDDPELCHAFGYEAGYNDAVARRVEPRASESGAGFESLPASPQWQGLTDEEIHECWPGLHVMDVSGQFYRNIEAKLRERNT
jgi:hypothetical protein